MIVYSCDTYDATLKKLQKKRKDGYDSCHKDVLDEISRCGYSILLDHKTNLFDGETYRVIKSRCKDSHQRLSSPNGYRFIAYLDKLAQNVYLMEVYPKRGKFSQNTIPAHAIANLLRDNIDAIQAGTCLQVYPKPK